jgi:hypothetical protein
MGLGRDETVHVRSQAPESAGREKRPGDRRCIRAPFLFLSLLVSTKSGARAMACKTLQKPGAPLESSARLGLHQTLRSGDGRAISLISAHNFECV